MLLSRVNWSSGCRNIPSKFTAHHWGGGISQQGHRTHREGAMVMKTVFLDRRNCVCLSCLTVAMLLILQLWSSGQWWRIRWISGWGTFRCVKSVSYRGGGGASRITPSSLSPHSPPFLLYKKLHIVLQNTPEIIPEQLKCSTPRGLCVCIPHHTLYMLCTTNPRLPRKKSCIYIYIYEPLVSMT